MNFLAYLALKLGNPFPGNTSPSVSNNNALEYYINLIYPILLDLVALAGVLMMIYGGFKYMTSEGNAEKINDAKETMIGAVVGMILLILAVFIAKELAH